MLLPIFCQDWTGLGGRFFAQDGADTHSLTHTQIFALPKLTSRKKGPEILAGTIHISVRRRQWMPFFALPIWPECLLFPAFLTNCWQFSEGGKQGYLQKVGSSWTPCGYLALILYFLPPKVRENYCEIDFAHFMGLKWNISQNAFFSDSDWFKFFFPSMALCTDNIT